MSTLSISLVPGALPADGEQITNSTLRAIARPTITLTGTIGTATVDDGAITTVKLADLALSADATGRAKMADGYTNAAKLATDAVETAKIKDANVTAVKLAEAARGDVHQYAAGAFSAGVYAITLSPAATVYTAGMVVRFKADLVNTGATDINVNAIGAKNLFTRDGKELVAGQIPAGALIDAVYDGTNFQCDLRSQYSAVAGATLAAGVQTFAHGLGVTPPGYKVRAVLVCTTNQSPWAVGDELGIEQLCHPSNGTPMTSCYVNATNIKVTLYQASMDAVSATGTLTPLTVGSWKVKVYAEL